MRRSALKGLRSALLEDEEERPGGLEGDAVEGFVFPFEKLEVWQRAVELADYVLGVMASVPKGKFLRLVGQMEAAVSSVSQNIAEGKGRQHRKEFVQFLFIAKGSLFEVVTLAVIFRRRRLFIDTEYQEIRKQAELIDRKLSGLINSVKKRGTP